MHRALRRAWWALAAAVGLGLVVSARTLSAADPVAPSKERAAPRPEGEAGRDAMAEDKRGTEIEVELAWLSDPLTFPYHLAARLEGSALHVRGFVQNKAAHDHALNLARALCALQVIDELKVLSSMVIAGMASAAAPSQPEAEAALQETFPDRTAPFRVTCRPGGQVTVTGMVPSLEEKLVVSQRLQQLPGCAAVMNQLRVGTAPATAAGPPPGMGPAHKMRGDSPRGEPARENWAAITHRQMDNSVPLAPLPVGPSPLPGPPVTTVSGVEPIQEPATAPGVRSAAPSEKREASPVEIRTAPPPAAGNAGLVPNAPLLARLQARVESVCGRGAMDVHLVPLSGRKLLVQFKARDDAEGARLAEKVLNMPELAVYHVDLDVKVAEPPTPSVRPDMGPPMTRTAPSPVKTPPAVTSVAKDPSPASPLPPIPRSGTAEPPRAVSSGYAPIGPHIVLKNDPVSARNDQPGDGVVYLMPEAPRPAPQLPPPPTPPAFPDQALLKERIKSICGSGASDIHLAVRAPRSVLIHFTAPNEAEGERLAAKAMAMPELSAYHVDLDVKVTDPPTTAAAVAAVALPAITQGRPSSKPQTLRLADPPSPPPAIAPVVWQTSPTPMTSGMASETVSISPPAPPARSPVVVTSTPAKQAPQTAGGPAAYVSTGVVVISEPVPPAALSPAPLNPADRAHLRERLEKVCGKQAEVQVLARSASSVLVQFKARNAIEADRLTNTILRLPELRPYQVDVDVKLAQ